MLQQRRQALGVISNKCVNNHGVLPTGAGAAGDEQSALLLLKKQSSDADFEIFQEEMAAATATSLQRSNAASTRENQHAVASAKLAPAPLVKCEEANKENAVDKAPQRVRPLNKDEQEEEDDEADYDDDDDNDDDEEEEVEEEEGISRLNAVVACEEATAASSDLTGLMDSSSSSASSSWLLNNDATSPMALDDTIQFQSLASALSEEEEDEEDSAELDEEARRRLEATERDTLLASCLDYKDDILAYMRSIEREPTLRPRASYMKKQQDINNSMRCILVDWLVEVSEEYKLNTETLHLAVNYTDRFLSQMSVLRGKLQLVGTAAMYIAAKYEEIAPPDVGEFVYITDDTYTKKQVLRMEHLLLKVLDFRMTTPTANYFLLHHLRALKAMTHTNSEAKLLAKVEHMAHYLAELTLVDANVFLGYLPSEVAAAALYVAHVALGKAWTRAAASACAGLPLFDGDESEQQRQCLADLHRCAAQAHAHPQQAVQDKYNSPKYQYVSELTIPPLPATNPHTTASGLTASSSKTAARAARN